MRTFAKSCLISVLGSECRPRRILRGLASGYTISVSPAEHLAYLVGTAEPHLQRAIRAYVAAGATVYDIGANIGYVSLSLAKQVGPSGRVIAFEPLPQNIARLKANIENNRLGNVQVMEVAASDRPGEAVIRLADNPSMASLMWHKKDPSAAELIVKAVAIDELVAARALPQPSFVKIDVEGSEGLAITGMRHTLAASRPVLFVESSDAGRGIIWPLLSNLRYRCKEPITGKWIDRFEDFRHADFLWLPEERAGS